MARLVHKTTARRAELFDQLVQLFLSEGFAHLTLDEISARLHCSKSTLYTVAAGKEDLVRAVTVHFFRAATDAVESAVAAETAPPRRVAVYLEAVGDRLSAASSQFHGRPGRIGVGEPGSTRRTRRSLLIVCDRSSSRESIRAHSGRYTHHLSPMPLRRRWFGSSNARSTGQLVWTMPALIGNWQHSSRTGSLRDQSLASTFMAPLNVEVIVGSVREGRMGRAVADWFVERATANPSWNVSVIDLRELSLRPGFLGFTCHGGFPPANRARRRCCRRDLRIQPRVSGCPQDRIRFGETRVACQADRIRVATAGFQVVFGPSSN